MGDGLADGERRRWAEARPRAGSWQASRRSSDVAVWSDERWDGWGKLLAVLWILAVLAYVLTPLASRLTRPVTRTERILATLDEVELVVTSDGGLDPALAPGERLLLRRRG